MIGWRALVGAAALLMLSGCTSYAELQVSPVHRLERYRRADIASVPRWAKEVSGTALHNEASLALGPERHTAYLLLFSTTKSREQVIGYYRSRYADEWRFGPVTDKTIGITATHGDLVARIHIVTLVGATEPDARTIRSWVEVLVSNRGDPAPWSY